MYDAVHSTYRAVVRMRGLNGVQRGPPRVVDDPYSQGVAGGMAIQDAMTRCAYHSIESCVEDLWSGQ